MTERSTTAKRTVSAAPKAAGMVLPWREFFVRLGDGTLHGSQPRAANSDARSRNRPADQRLPEPAFR